MQIEHLNILKTVMQYGSMNKAAKELFCTQPTVSNAIKAIEQELKQPVIERTAGGITPTRLGEMVLEDTHLILSYVERWKRYARQDPSQQDVSITLTGTVPRYRLVSRILELQKEHPELKINIRYTSLRGSQWHGMRTEEMSRINISYWVPKHIPACLEFAQRHGLRLARLQEDEFCVFTSRDNTHLHGEGPLSLEDLRDQELLFYQNTDAFPYLDMVKAAGGRVAPELWQEENLMLALMLDPKLMALRPETTTDNSVLVKDQSIAVRRFAGKPMPVNLCVLYPDAGRVTKAEQLFIKSLQREFPGFAPLGPQG